MKLLTRSVLLAALLLACLARADGQTTYTQQMQFGASGQSMWPQGMSNGIWSYNLWYGTAENAGGFIFGDHNAGIEVNLNYDSGTGVIPWVAPGPGGMINLSYPVTFSMTYPANGTVQAGQTLNIGTSWQPGSGGVLELDTPTSFDLGANLWFTDHTGTGPATLSVSDGVWLLGHKFEGILQYVLGGKVNFTGPSGWNQPGLNASTLWDLQQMFQSGYPATGSVDQYGVTLSWGIVEGAKWYGSVGAGGNASINNNLGYLDLDGDLTAMAVAVTPGLDGFEELFNGGGSVSLGDGDASVNWEIDGLDASETWSLPVAYTFQASPQVTLQVSPATTFTDATTNQTWTGTTVGPFNVGDNVTAIMPAAGLQMIPTVSLPNQLNASVSLNMSPGFSQTPLAVSGRVHYDGFYGYGRFTVGGGYSDSTDLTAEIFGQRGEVNVPVVSSTWTLGGITPQQGAPIIATPFQGTVTPVAGPDGAISPAVPTVVPTGGSITFTATPAAEYAVGVWQVDGATAQTGGASFTLSNVIANHAVSVSFLPPFRVIPSAGAGGSISPYTLTNVVVGSSITFTATPDAGYVVADWQVDGVVAQLGSATFVLSNVQSNHAVTVNFHKVVAETVTPSAGPGGTISPAKPQKVSYGDSITFTAQPKSGHMVSAWSVNGAIVPGYTSTSYTVGFVTGPTTVKVSFASIPAHDFIINSSFENPSISNFAYTPTGAGWTFTGWTGIAHNGSAFGNANAPDGVQVGILQAIPGSPAGVISQSVNFSGGTYTITVAAASRPGYGVQPIQFSVDGVNIGAPFSPADASFADVTTPGFTVTAGLHTIAFTTTNFASDSTTFIDNVRLLK